MNLQSDVIAFSLTALGCPSLDYVYEMSLAEFYIRLHGFNRQELRRYREFRRQLYVTATAPHLDPKKLPKTEAGYMALPGERVNKVSSRARERFLEKTKAYLEKTKAPL